MKKPKKVTKKTGTVGRPKIEIDFEQLDNLCALHCSQVEVAAWFGVSIDTIEARIKERTGLNFPEYFAQKSGKGKISLRRAMWAAAMNGDAARQIFLAKNWLGMADRTHSIAESTVKLSLEDWTTEQLEERARKIIGSK